MFTKYTTAMKINIGSHLHVACNPAALQVLSNLPHFLYTLISVHFNCTCMHQCTKNCDEIVLRRYTLFCIGHKIMTQQL